MAHADRAFLKTCAVERPEEWDGADASLRSLREPEWRDLARHAVLHGFVGLAARNLAWARDRLQLDIPVLEELAALRRGQLVQQLNRKAAARRAAMALEGEGIPCIAFKGVVLGEEIYGDLSLRGFRDFDVMVPRERVEHAYSVLLAMGYRLPHLDHIRDWMTDGVHAVGLSHADGSSVDLHWSFAHDVLDRERVALMWKHSRPAPPHASLPGRRLSPEMTLIHLAKHFHSHQYCSFKPLVDCYVIMRRLGHEIDPGVLEATARQLRLMPVVEVAIQLCERSFIANTVPAALRRNRPGVAARAACLVVTERFLLHSPRLPRITNWLRYLVTSGSLGAAMKSIVGFLVPDRILLTQFFRQPYQARMYPRYYWRQFVKVVTFSSK
jgi:hypothetical protein